MAAQRDPDDSGFFGIGSDRAFRLVASLGLLLGAGSGLWTVGNTDDRYRGTDAARDFALRDKELSYIEKRLSKVEEDVVRIDRVGPTMPNAQLRATVDDLAGRLENLERWQ